LVCKRRKTNRRACREPRVVFCEFEIQKKEMTEFCKGPTVELCGGELGTGRANEETNSWWMRGGNTIRPENYAACFSKKEKKKGEGSCYKNQKTGTPMEAAGEIGDPNICCESAKGERKRKKREEPKCTNKKKAAIISKIEDP